MVDFGIRDQIVPSIILPHYLIILSLINKCLNLLPAYNTSIPNLL